MNKKKFFGLLTSAALLLNGAPLMAFAEEMKEASGVVGAVTNADGSVAINSTNFSDDALFNAVQAAAKAQNVTDAAKIKNLTVPSNVEDFSGLEYLTGLETLSIDKNNNIEELNLTTNTALKTLTVTNSNSLYSLTLPTTQSLTKVTISGNPALTSLDLSPASVLTTADISGNGIAQLDLSGNAFLNTLDVSENKLYSLDTTNCPKLVTLNAENNKIYEFDIVESEIAKLNLAGNKLREFDGSNMSALKSLNVADNMLETITLPDDNHITYFNCDENHLASLDLSDAVTSGAIVITGNQTLFAGTNDEGIDLKAYDDDFESTKATIIDPETGKATGEKFPTNGVVTLPDSEESKADDESKADGEFAMILEAGEEEGDYTIAFAEISSPVTETLPYTLPTETSAFTVTKKEDNSKVTSFTVTWAAGTDGTIADGDATTAGTYTATLKDGDTILGTIDLEVKDADAGEKPGDNESKADDEELLVEAEQIEVRAQLATAPTKTQVTVEFDPSAVAGKGLPEDATFEVLSVKGTATIKGKTINLTFEKDSSDSTGKTWMATPTNSPETEVALFTLEAGATEWSDVPENVVVEGEVAVSAPGFESTVFNFTIGDADSDTYLEVGKPTTATIGEGTPANPGTDEPGSNKPEEGDSVLTPAEAAFAYTYNTSAKNNNMTVYVYQESIMNRLYNPNSGEHFYTRDTHERDVLVSLGWQSEGVGWVAPKASADTTPVYRLYNKNAGDHHYTKDANEKDTLVKIGWTFEGVGWYSAPEPKIGNRTIEVFREYNPNAKEAGAHNYTISENENVTLVSLGWTDEGIAWNALK